VVEVKERVRALGILHIAADFGHCLLMPIQEEGNIQSHSDGARSKASPRLIAEYGNIPGSKRRCAARIVQDMAAAYSGWAIVHQG
jgi:hypothetical protein